MQQYSVLMPVYHKEDAGYFRTSIESMINQSIPTDDFVIVCDGPLTAELNAVIRDYTRQYPELFHIVRMKKNRGLGIALQEGISACKHELVARMDSDDISAPDRCERQLAVFAAYPYAIVGGNVEEFTEFPAGFSQMQQSKSPQAATLGNPAKSAPVRKVPETNEKIRAFAKRRNPFNHPSVMFVKSAVQKAGGYLDCKGFEDYYLWVRMLGRGMQGYNIQRTLVYMRTDAGMYERRGSLSYAWQGFLARWKIHKTGYSGLLDFAVSAGGQVIMSLIPVRLRTCFYSKFLRK